MTNELAIQEMLTVASHLKQTSQGEAVMMGAVALDKQIPKKPIIGGPYGDYCGTFYSCPICKEDFGGYFPFNMDEDLELPDYCPSCGQRLEWKL